jgi:hypothetical protein
MKRILAGLSVAALLSVVACGSDKDDSSTSTPDAACKSIVAELCSKFFGCFTKDELAAAASVVGNNEADCRTKYEQQQCSSQMLKCDSGESYSSSKANECLDQFKSFSCDEFGTGNTPAACDAICM